MSNRKRTQEPKTKNGREAVSIKYTAEELYVVSTALNTLFFEFCRTGRWPDTAVPDERIRRMAGVSMRLLRSIDDKLGEWVNESSETSAVLSGISFRPDFTWGPQLDPGAQLEIFMGE